MQYFKSFFFISLLVVLSSAADVEVLTGPLDFWFLDCHDDECTVLTETKHLNAETGSEFLDIDVPKNLFMRLYVNCRNVLESCEMSYFTNAWNKTVTIPAKESSTFAAETVTERMTASVIPSYYTAGDDVEVIVSFTFTNGDMEAVPLIEEEISIKNGKIMGDIKQISKNSYSFHVQVVEGESFAVLLSDSILSENGIPLSYGFINMVLFDNTLPIVKYVDYISAGNEDAEDKRIKVVLNKPVTGRIVEGILNTARYVEQDSVSKNIMYVYVSGNGIGSVVFTDELHNSVSFEVNAAYCPNCPMKVLDSPAENSTVPRNGRLEFVFNHYIEYNQYADAIFTKNGESFKVPLSSTDVFAFQANHLHVFVTMLAESGEYSVVIPAEAIKSGFHTLSEALEFSFTITETMCNTDYVVNGMGSDSCKCFSMGGRCQCDCGETSFSRAINL